MGDEVEEEREEDEGVEREEVLGDEEEEEREEADGELDAEVDEEVVSVIRLTSVRMERFSVTREGSRRVEAGANVAAEGRWLSASFVSSFSSPVDADVPLPTRRPRRCGICTAAIERQRSPAQGGSGALRTRQSVSSALRRLCERYTAALVMYLPVLCVSDGVR